jgi:hypothetical protein
MVSAPLSGCAYFSKNGRQQLAYERYVRRQTKWRYRQRVKTKTPRVPKTEPSENKISAEADSPQAMTTGEESSPQAVTTGNASPP